MPEQKHPSPINCQSWQQLKDHYQSIKNTHLNHLFTENPDRAKQNTIKLDTLLVDYSKNRINEETLSLLFALAEEMQLMNNIEAMFSGENINNTEHRPALHTVLRSPDENISIDGVSVRPLIDAELSKMETISEQIRNKQFSGASGKAIDTIIHIGIGGSDLGPRLAVEALQAYADNKISCHFVANIDATDIENALQDSNPDTTLFILASKSFSTMETLANGNIAKQWLKNNHCSDLSRHLIAITSNESAAIKFGINPENIFSFWSWVGGRYSVWSTIGLPIAICLGMDNFRQFLSGANEMDKHFRLTESSQNIPVVLGLLDVWYSNFFETETLAVVPYEQSLHLFADYLSQLIMESNGKSIDKNGEAVSWNTAPIVWGSVGTNGQHAFFQLLHQGTQLVPIDFLVAVNCSHEHQEQHNALVASCFAQSEALMLGHTPDDENEPYRLFQGNRPSTTILYDKLDAKTLGMLIALYEHRTFVQACICNINPFDQWGVELGKKLTGNILEEINEGQLKTKHDDSTTQLLSNYPGKRLKPTSGK